MRRNRDLRDASDRAAAGTPTVQATLLPDGAVEMKFASTITLGNAIVGVKLDANKQLQLVDYFAPKNANWMRAREALLDSDLIPGDTNGVSDIAVYDAEAQALTLAAR